jgi:phage gpG-like protein
MASIDIKVRMIDNDIPDEIEKIKDNLDDFGPVFKEAKEDLQTLWRNNFLQNGLPAGGWKPLDAEYGSWKSINFPGKGPMVRSGKLFRSLTDLRGNPNKIDKKEATFGTNIKYAEFHQSGTRNMPARPVVFVTERYERKWVDSAAEHAAG